MNWETLYTTQRTGVASERQRQPDPVRNAFQKDYDRIIFSSAFRRLQNKTQVFPLPGSVFVHNRLTHSLEVTSVGRSLGKAVGERIAEKHPNIGPEFTEFYKYELPSVIAAACLAHDIGNPPFGHSGEDAIRTFFDQMDGDVKKAIHEHASPAQLSDLLKFEGNANALRVLTHNYNEPEPGGYRLTFTTLASLVKYPCASLEGFNKVPRLIATKKTGYFTHEVGVYQQIASSMAIPQTAGYNTVYSRHPFVYLVEAADDICYRVIDLEDAHRLGIISLTDFMSLFLPFFPEHAEGEINQSYIHKKLTNIYDAKEKVKYIRALWIGLMTDKITDAFMGMEPELLAGNLQLDLLHCLPEDEKVLIDAINTFSVKHIYNYRSVVEIELAGYNIIGGLLKAFIEAVVEPHKSRSAKLIELVSKQFPIVKDRSALFNDVQSIVDFIAGMTDLYAIELYRKITGITIPELR